MYVPVAHDAVLGAQRPVYAAGGARPQAQARVVVWFAVPCWGILSRPWQETWVCSCGPAIHQPTTEKSSAVIAFQSTTQSWAWDLHTEQQGSSRSLHRMACSFPPEENVTTYKYENYL